MRILQKHTTGCSIVDAGLVDDEVDDMRSGIGSAAD